MPAEHRYVPRGTSVWHVSMRQLGPGGKLSAWFRTECAKPDNRKYEREGATHVAVLTHAGSRPRSREVASRRKNWKLLDEGDVAAWLDENPFVQVPGRSFQQLFRVEHVQRLADIVTPDEYAHDPTLDQIIADVRAFVAGAERALRVEGPAGVGKTRAVYEAIAGDDVRASGVGWCANSSQSSAKEVREFLTRAADNKGLVATLVLDECPAKDHDEWVNIAGLSDGRVKVITIGPPDTAVPILHGRVLELSELGEAAIRRVLETYGLDSELHAKFVRLAKGFVKAATLLGGAFRRGPRAGNPPVTADAATWFREALRRLCALTEPEQRVVECLALFAEFPSPHEADHGDLDGVLGLSKAERRDLVRVFRKLEKHHAKKRGTFVYLTPDVMAEALAYDAIEQEGDPSIVAIVRRLSHRSKEAMLRRLIQMRDTHEYRQRVEALIRAILASLGGGPGSTTGSDSVLLSLLPPDMYTDALTHLERLAREQNTNLLDREIAARATLLARIAQSSELFARAAALLSEIGATPAGRTIVGARWRSLFVLGFAPTAARNDDRVSALRAASLSASAGVRRLALDGASEMISPRFAHAGEPRPPNRPDDGRDAATLWRAALDILIALTDDAVAEIRESARGTLRTDLRDVLARAPRVALEALRAADPSMGAGRQSVLTAVLEALEYDAPRLPVDVSDSLRAIAKTLEGESFPLRLRRWVSTDQISEMFGDGRERATEALRELAEEGLRTPSPILDEIGYLCSGEARRGFDIGYALGDLDERWELLARLEPFAGRAEGDRFIGGYLVGRAVRERGRVEDILDDWLQRGSAWSRTAVAATILAHHSPRGLVRLLRAVSEHGQAPYALRWLETSGWGDAISNSETRDVLLLLLRIHTRESTAVALGLLRGWRSRHVAEVSALDDVETQLVDALPLVLASRGIEPLQDWEHAALRVARRAPKSTAQLVVEAVTSVPLRSSDAELASVLGASLAAAPQEVWPIIGGAIMRSAALRETARDVLSSVPVDVVTKWLKSAGIEGARALAWTVRVTLPDPGPVARLVLDRYSTDPEVARALNAAHLRGAWVGTFREYVSAKERATSEFIGVADGAAAYWARSHLESLERMERNRENDTA